MYKYFWQTVQTENFVEVWSLLHNTLVIGYYE